jgi:Glucose / Sorbosone dehydrogenase
MRRDLINTALAGLFLVSSAFGQAREGQPPPPAQPGQGRGPAGPYVPSGPGRSNDPFPAPISATEGVVAVNVVEFATIPDAGTAPPRMNLLRDEPGTRRLFVNTMQGMIYAVSYDGKTVKPYIDINDPKWGNPVQFAGTERGFQSFAFHPQFAESGKPGYGKFYTWADTSNMLPQADFVPLGAGHTHDEILLEWTAKNPKADAYDGDMPRELIRVAHPFTNHNGGEIAFNPLAKQGTPEYGLLYVGSADGGSGGDPYNHAQNLKSIFGKILRIDPLGRNSPNGKYGIPASNPFVKNSEALGEVYSYGHRNPQRFSWDPKNGNMFEAEIGQNINEEINQIVKGGNYGWNVWEGSFKYFGREVSADDQRADSTMVFPIAEFDHTDPLFPSRRLAATGVFVYRGNEVKPLKDKLVFGDNPSGEIFWVNADRLPTGGQSFHRVLFNDKGATKTLLQLIKEKNEREGRNTVSRADLRMDLGPRGQIFVMNKHDGTIRMLVP